jgi:hypothetical protein
VVHQPPIAHLPRRERWELGIAVERAACFSDLTPDQQRLILDAETARERAIAEQRRFVAS